MNQLTCSTLNWYIFVFFIQPGPAQSFKADKKGNAQRVGAARCRQGVCNQWILFGCGSEPKLTAHYLAYTFFCKENAGRDEQGRPKARGGCSCCGTLP
jgi:hypothetical protein